MQGDEKALPTPKSARQEAVRRIRECEKTGQTWLDLGDLDLEELPPELGQLTHLRLLALGKHRPELRDAAFGYLRGIRDQATSVELRFRDGNSMFFPYGWMGTWQYNPSEGLLLKFSGDLVYLVLIKGSNLDKPLNEGAINLTRGGLQRHRVLWLREMTPDEIRQVGESGPTIDSIEVAEFESQAAIKEWLNKKAAAFMGVHGVTRP